jgi:DNA-binding transcriptional LysR family regulator
MEAKISWELYRSYLSVLKEGSLSAAARDLGITQPTVGRHIAALERALGLALFTRSQFGLMPTEAAQGLRAYAETMASTAASLERAATAHGEGVRGVVRVSASDVMGVEVLPSLIEQVRRRYPDLKVELVLSNRVQDLLRGEADIAVRMMRPEQEQLLARRVGSIEIGLHAHRDYLARRGTPHRVGELAGHALIGFDQPSAYVRKASRAVPYFSRDSFSIYSDSDLAQLALIRSGAGIGGCQVPLARRNDRLVRVLSAEFSLQLETWVAMHEDLRASPRCRVMFDALVQGLQGYIK